MIAIMTWSNELDEEIRDCLNDSSIINSFEELSKNKDIFNKVILKRNQSWTLTVLESMLEYIKILEKEIYYIVSSYDTDEIWLLIKLDIKNILFEPIETNEIINRVKSSDKQDKDYFAEGFFDESLYADEPIYTIDTNDIEDDEGLYDKAVEIKKVEPKPDVNKEGIVRFLLSELIKFILSVLKLIRDVIVSLFDGIQGILLTVLLSLFITGVLYVLNKQGISTPEFLDEIFNMISDIIAKLK